MFLSNGNLADFLDQFRVHFYTFQTRIAILRKEQRADEFKWRANQMRLMFVLLETYPAQSSQQITFKL